MQKDVEGGKDGHHMQANGIPTVAESKADCLFYSATLQFTYSFIANMELAAFVPFIPATGISTLEAGEVVKLAQGSHYSHIC